MRLVVVWHKPCWPSTTSPTGFAAHGGLPRQIEALSGCFDATRVVGPAARPRDDRSGETPIAGKNVSVVRLTWLSRSPYLTWLALPLWLARNGFTLTREVARADAVFALIPSPIGMLGLVVALLLKKPLLTRQLNDWSDRRLLWRLERALLERVAGGRNVVFATGGSEEPPSRRNRAIRWIFSTTLSEHELTVNAAPRRRTCDRSARLVSVAREVDVRGTRIALRALPILAREFPSVGLSVAGAGASVSAFAPNGEPAPGIDRTVFRGALDHEGVMAELRHADLFCALSPDTEGVRHAVHEALASGLPVVATHTLVGPAFGDGAGVMFCAPTPEALAAAVSACLADPDRYRRMSIEALRTAQAYSLERWRDEIVAALEAAWGPLRAGEP